MMRPVTIAAWLMAGAISLGTYSVRAGVDVLRLVPGSASGVLVINRLAATDAKLQAAGREMQLPLPSPLAMLKQFSNIREGVDETGSIALITLPPEMKDAMPTPILLIPVMDYGKFLAQLNPEEAAAPISKVRVMNAPALVRNIAGYAALTDADHRPVLENLKLADAVPGVVAPWRDWLAGNDAAVVILRPGIEQISSQAQERIQAAKKSMAKGPEQVRAVAGVMDVYTKLFQVAEREVAALGLGLQLDKQNALRLATSGPVC